MFQYYSVYSVTTIYSDTVSQFDSTYNSNIFSKLLENITLCNL